MKSLFYTLALLLFVNHLYAQQHLFTLAELKQLANCPDQDCFKKAVQPWGYRYRKEDSEVTDSTGFYSYFNRQMEPYRAEAFIIQEDLGPYGQRVIFSTNNKAFQTQLETDIQQSGYTLSSQPAPSEAREYTRQEGNLTWALRREKLSFSGVSENFMITLYRTSKSVSTTARLIATKLTSTEPPHLGGDWDTKYPPQNVADILKAERQYTVDYEHKHGKTGHTFSRVEKVRIQGTRTGQYRPLTDKRWSESFDLALRTMGFEAFANDRNRLYKQEALFDIGGERIWVPIQEIIIKTLENESKVGELITLYTVLVSHHNFGGTLHLSFLVNEFAAAHTTDTFSASSESIKPTNTNTQPSEEIKIRQETVVPKTTSVSAIKKASSVSCGFNWVAWSAVSATEKAAMKKVMVPDLEGGYVGSLLQYILDEAKKGNKIQIARHDFYQKKQPGYIVYIEYLKSPDGKKGRVEVYEDLGESYLFPPVGITDNLCVVRPADDNKGIIREDGRQDAFTNISLFFEKTYAQFLKDTKQEVAVPVPSTATSTNRLGAKTPEELAILLLKCLKTNDKAIWMRCMHPDESVETDEVSSRKFDRHRESMASDGITNWSLVQYSRLTYPLRPTGGDKVDPNKTIPHSTLEFTYKNQEFIGEIKIGTFSFYEGRWLVWFSGFPEDCRIYRNFGR